MSKIGSVKVDFTAWIEWFDDWAEYFKRCPEATKKFKNRKGGRS